MSNLFRGRFLKTKPSTLLVLGIMGIGLGSGVVCFSWYAIYNPEKRRLKDSERWNEDAPNYQYKVPGLTKDYSTLKRNRPAF